MCEVYKTYKHIISCLENIDNPSLKLSLKDVHGDYIFSLVVDGTEPGKLTRIFIAGKTLLPFEVQFHSHRYQIKLTTIKGDITHHRAFEFDDNVFYNEYQQTRISKYKYESALNGKGTLTYLGETAIQCKDYKMPPGSQIKLSASAFHTMSVSKGSMWIVEELGYEKDSSEVLGIPFQTHGLYNKPTILEIHITGANVLRELRNIVKKYNHVNF